MLSNLLTALSSCRHISRPTPFRLSVFANRLLKYLAVLPYRTKMLAQHPTYVCQISNSVHVYPTRSGCLSGAIAYRIYTIIQTSTTSWGQQPNSKPLQASRPGTRLTQSVYCASRPPTAKCVYRSSNVSEEGSIIDGHGYQRGD